MVAVRRDDQSPRRRQLDEIRFALIQYIGSSEAAPHHNQGKVAQRVWRAEATIAQGDEFFAPRFGSDPRVRHVDA